MIGLALIIGTEIVLAILPRLLTGRIKSKCAEVTFSVIGLIATMALLLTVIIAVI